MSKAASIKARLRNLAILDQKPYEYIQTHYLIERLLFRLSISRYSHDFVLKGGLLLHVIFEGRARATRDIDFLARYVSNAPENIKDIFLEVCSISADDAVSFNPDSIVVEHITEDADYSGVRIKIVGLFDRSRSTLQFDIGFGDVVVPKPEEMVYPSLLDMDEIRLLVYSKESIIAEKFQAMLYLAQANSRMKDFYDIYLLASEFDFDGGILREAVYQTVTRRGTPLEEVPVVFTDAFVLLAEKQAQWQAFCRRIHQETIPFSDAMTSIRRLLEPIYHSILHEDECLATWRHVAQSWV